ncbi:uncharacterized protein BXZ73DRAFT_108268 [Epithele typhae]|uniref:uncharacterized protein n=1 Tax=Epithele typhae TaxID=378194 RepID=UPI0020081634|nr:uncharacterized protein BXZ73DRAFT_108268 [Epithele typhae]KAH9911053.1 hypothetical protein BXZ73DRAFT_108268 [Epithele typhae]
MLNPSDHPLLKYDILVEVFSKIEISGQDGWPYYWGDDAYCEVKGEGSTTLARAARLLQLSLLDVGEEEDSQTDIALEVDQDVFPALRELVIQHCGAVAIGRALALLSTSPSCPLASLRLDASHRSDLEAVNVVRHLALPSFGRTLRTLCLLFSYHSTIWDWEQTTSLEPFPARAVLEPLLSLGALEDVEVYTRERPLALADADLVRWARAWPRLRRLRVVYDGDDYPQAHEARATDPELPSLLAAADLATACARLEVLVLALADVTEADARALEARARAESGGQGALVQLVPAGSGTRRERMRIWETERVCGALLRMFPNLEGSGILEDGERRVVAGRTSWLQAERRGIRREFDETGARYR